MHTVICLRWEDVTFITGKWKVEGRISPGADTIEVRFRGSKGDDGWKGAVLVRTKDDRNKGGKA